jgi:hypothetical protein
MHFFLFVCFNLCANYFFFGVNLGFLILQGLRRGEEFAA